MSLIKSLAAIVLNLFRLSIVSRREGLSFKLKYIEIMGSKRCKWLCCQQPWVKPSLCALSFEGNRLHNWANFKLFHYYLWYLIQYKQQIIHLMVEVIDWSKITFIASSLRLNKQIVYNTAHESCTGFIICCVLHWSRIGNFNQCLSISLDWNWGSRMIVPFALKHPLRPWLILEWMHYYWSWDLKTPQNKVYSLWHIVWLFCFKCYLWILDFN